MKFRTADCLILSADADHPISSKLCKPGSLHQQGISGEGFQREVGISRHTGPKGASCWTLQLYQHPGVRRVVALGCTNGTTPPANVRMYMRAFHRLAESGVPRGRAWQRLVLEGLLGQPTVKSMAAALRDEGVFVGAAWNGGDGTADDVTAGLGRMKRAKRRR